MDLTRAGTVLFAQVGYLLFRLDMRSSQLRTSGTGIVGNRQVLAELILVGQST